MDSRRFDTLTKSLSSTDTRRSIARLLAVLPLGAALTALLGNERDTTAKDDDHGSSHRRHRRKAKHRHQTGNDKEHRKGKRKGCKPKSDAKTCAGKCGTVRNNCGKRVDCGSCACTPSCPLCQTCDAATRTCVPIANRTVCGGTGNATSVCCNGTCCDGCCGANGSCGACLVFVTSTAHTGNLGGLAGADGICQTRASAAKRPGTYMAWLSDSTASPATRFRCTQASCSLQGYTLIDGTPVAGNWDELTDGNLDAAISMTEIGGPPPYALAWTHTLIDGSAGGAGPANAHCNNWAFTDPGTLRGDTGQTVATDSLWTVNADGPCNALAELYCFQQS